MRTILIKPSGLGRRILLWMASIAPDPATSRGAAKALGIKTAQAHVAMRRLRLAGALEAIPLDLQGRRQPRIAYRFVPGVQVEIHANQNTEPRPDPAFLS